MQGMSVSAAKLRDAARADLRLVTPGVLTVIAYTDFYPVCHMSGRRVVGSDAAIVERFAASLGLRVEYVRASAYADVYRLTGTADMGIGGVAMTPERASPYVVWSAPYAVTERTLVCSTRAPVASFPRDVDRPILGTEGSTGFADALARLSPAKRHLLIPETGGEAESVRRLLDGSVQGLVRGSMVGGALMRRFPGRVCMTAPWTVPGAPETFRFPCLRRSGVEPHLSAFLGAALADGTIAELKANATETRSRCRWCGASRPTARPRWRC